MSKIILSEEDKKKISESMNKGTELPPELLIKLFPGTAEKFDVQALDRAKIPTIEYAGKRSKTSILAEAGAGIGAAPLQTVRCFGEIISNEWRNLIVQGDNMQFLKTCYKNTDPLIKDKVKGQVKLIYIDPPFATKSDFEGKEGERSYSDKVDTAEFIEALRERLIYMREMLSDDGSIYVHLDQKMSHYIKIIMDEIFGKENFVNEIIWQKIRSSKGQAKSFGNVHDTIFCYSKSDKMNFENQYKDFDEKYISSHYKPDSTGRLYRTVSLLQKGSGTAKNFNGKILKPPAGMHWIWSQERIDEAFKNGLIRFTSNGRPEKIQYLDEMKGDIVDDLWCDIYPINSQALEAFDYPTQKPEALLERIIMASSNPDDLIMDLFGGSGTTVAVAEKLGRRWITCDFGKHSIYTMQKRILRIGESKALIEEKNKEGKVVIKKGDTYNKPPKPFCIISSGTYDFTRVMNLSKNSDTYIDFVLGLFQLTRDDEKSKKFKLAHIYAIKDNNPVEVYPVWDVQFLKNIRIDEKYLKEIIHRSGGKLKGAYYIITPESCTNISDTTINKNGKEITFYIKTFPYKILEEVSRNFELQEQPSSQANVNNLITSSTFYFNEDVELEAKRTKEGLQITYFKTKILDSEGNLFDDLSGLAMLLVDIDYDPKKPFDMDKTIFANEIAQDGSIILEGIEKKSVGLIAIDKHGNESKLFNLK